MNKLTPSEIYALKQLLVMECNYSLSDEVMDRLLGSGEVRALARGEAIVKAGETDGNIYFVVEGITRHWYMNGSREKTVFFAQPGSMLISYYSYYFGMGSFYTIEACSAARVLCVRKETFDRMIAESHEFAQWCLSMAQCHLFLFEMRSSVISGDARERYASLLENRPEILELVPLKIIASYLDVTPQYLSKLRKQTS